MLKMLQKEKANSLVEFALALPLLVFLLLGTFDLGHGFVTYMALANGAREGARWLSVNPTDVAGARAQVRAEAGQVTSVNPAAVTVTITPAKSKYNAGDKVTIKASYSYLLLFGAVTGKFSVPMSIQTTMTVLY